MSNEGLGGELRRKAPWSTGLETLAGTGTVHSDSHPTSRPTVEAFLGEIVQDKPTLTEGVKYDVGKIRWDLMPYGPLEEVAKLYTFGAVKYEPWNWRKGIAYSRCFAALTRHLFDWWWNKKSKDDESGCHPLAAVVFYCLNFMQYEMDQRKCDDRYIPEVQP